VIQASPRSRILIAGQAPGTRVQASGRPFTDPSGVRLREWLGVDEATFYDAERIAIVPMGHCFPGLDAKGGDLPPRRECAPRWRGPIMAALPAIAVILVIGRYARDWHLPERKGERLSTTIMDWRAIGEMHSQPRIFPLPHPSWRNNAWLRTNPWFENDLLPDLRRALGAIS
jgi:uracil-DNA glycosylase